MINKTLRLTAARQFSYADLLGEDEWQKLHPLVQKRFSCEAKKSAVYAGVMKKISMSRAGQVFAQLCRLIGTPLALYRGKNVPMRVEVYADDDRGGMTCCAELYG